MTAKNQTAKIIDGKAIAEGIRSRIASEVSRMKELIGQVPSLAVILVGQRPDSQTYVRNKIIASEEVGIKLKMTCLLDNCSEREVCNALYRYNEDPSIHGILVQLPLPKVNILACLRFFYILKSVCYSQWTLSKLILICDLYTVSTCLAFCFPEVPLGNSSHGMFCWSSSFCFNIYAIIIGFVLS